VEESVVSIKQRIKKKHHFFRRCWSDFADFNDAEMAADFSRLGNALILFGLGILFYVRRVLWKEEKDHKP